MRPYLIATAIVLSAIYALLGVPRVVDFAQASLAATNVPSNPVKTADAPQVAGVQKIQLTPVNQGLPVPTISATAALVKDLDGDFILYAKDPNKQVPIASTTKIMTALISSQYFKPNETLTVPENITSITGSTMNLHPNERITYRSLLYGMLLNSGNDAAFTIATNFQGGVAGFVLAMNAQNAVLGLQNTHFDNPAGFDSPNHYSSAFDLAKIAAQAMEDPQIARVVATKQAEVASVDKTIIHPLKNLNILLDKPGVVGIKTGTTPLAKENFVGLIEKDNHRILTVVLGSDDRFGETQKLMDWAYQNFKWQ